MQTQDYINLKNLLVHKSANTVFLLGYRLILTKTEYAILKALSENAYSTLSCEMIADITLLELSKENIAFHVFNINKKAKSISNRILIKNISKIGYFLNEEM